VIIDSGDRDQPKWGCSGPRRRQFSTEGRLVPLPNSRGMPTERLSMRQIREVLRLRFASKLSQRAIAKSLRLSQGAVSGYLSRARAAGVVWPLPDDLDDPQLEARLFPPAPAIAVDQRSVPDWAWVHRELRRPNVTLALLWEEYRAGAPNGFGYSGRGAPRYGGRHSHRRGRTHRGRGGRRAGRSARGPDGGQARSTRPAGRKAGGASGGSPR
jgi:hypothetical protein